MCLLFGWLVCWLVGWFVLGLFVWLLACFYICLFLRLFFRHGYNFRVQQNSVLDEIDEIYRKASYLKLWSVVRYTAALLGKVVDSLAPSITTMLVSGRQVCAFFPCVIYCAPHPLCAPGQYLSSALDTYSILFKDQIATLSSSQHYMALTFLRAVYQIIPIAILIHFSVIS